MITQFANSLKGLPLSEATLLRILESIQNEKVKAVITITYNVFSVILKICLYLVLQDMVSFLSTFSW